MLQPKLADVTPLPGGRLLLEYETGELLEFDASPYMSGSWYAELRDAAYFNSVRMLPHGIGIEWPHGQDVAPHELYELGVPVTVRESA